MGIESWRWFHWLPIGLALGAIIGGVRVATREPLDDSPARTLGRADLDSALIQGLPDGRPAVFGLTVHPPDDRGTWWVTGQRTRLLQVHTDARDPNSPVVDAEVRAPFKLAGGPGIRDELRRIHAAYPQTAAEPAFAWQDKAAIQVALWTIGTAALIGGVWPPVMALLIGAGFGRRSIDPAYDLNAFQPEPPTPSPNLAPNPAVQAIDDLVDALATADPSHNNAPPEPPPVPTLSAQPLQPAAPDSGPAKDYAGQFYPTQVHVPPQRPPGS